MGLVVTKYGSMWTKLGPMGFYKSYKCLEETFYLLNDHNSSKVHYFPMGQIIIWSQTSARKVPYGRRYFGAKQVPGRCHIYFGAEKVSRWYHLRNYNLVPNKCQGGAIWEVVFWCQAGAMFWEVDGTKISHWVWKHYLLNLKID